MEDSDKFPVLKQDINFMDKPLWFVDVRQDSLGSVWKQDGLGGVWKDIDGYEYRIGYQIPDKIDGLILLYLLLKSQKLGFQEKIVVSRYEILKECGLSKSSHAHYYKRLEESLKRWKNVSIEFKGTFYDGKAYKSYLFGILNEAKIRESDGQLEIEFNNSWLTRIKESQFFKYINFGYYKSLKRPVSMRLYELLAKNYKGRNECHFKLTTLGVKLTLSGRKVKTRSGERDVIYASDVLVAIKPAIKEINKLALTPDILEKTGILPEDVFTLTFEIKGKRQDRVIFLTKHPVFSEKVTRKSSAKTEGTTRYTQSTQSQIKSKTEENSQAAPKHLAGIIDPAVAERSIQQQKKKESVLQEEQLNTLFSQLKKKTKALKDVISKYYDEHGYDYVLWNIRYANANATKNYSVYLQKSLAENWACEWVEGQVEKKQEETAKTEKRKAITKAIEAAGGIRSACYQGSVIEDCFDKGILMGNTITPWDIVDPQEIAAAGTDSPRQKNDKY